MIARWVEGPSGPVVVRATSDPVPLIEEEGWDRRVYRWYGDVLGILILAYLFLDRGVAHFHLPKTPAFIGEMTLALGVLAILCGTQWLRRALSGDTLLTVLIAFMAWGLVRTLPNMHIFGIQVTVRDAALWYYAGFAIALVAAATAQADLVPRWIRGFRRVVPWLTLWLPIALLLERSGVTGPKFRYSSVPLLSHKPGNICCAAVICLAFLLLVPESEEEEDARRRPRSYRRSLRVFLIVVNLFTMLLGATQTRGGAIAEVLGILVILALMERTRRNRVIVTLAAGLFVVVAVGLVTGAQYHTQKRTISISQLLSNAGSLSGSDGGNSQLNGSVSFRFDLWATILNKQDRTSHLVNGFGFGPNLARTGGLNPRPNQPATLQLRSAHNSWLDIFGRMGIVGMLLFLIVWIGWFRRMGKAHRHGEDDDMRGLIGVCLCGSLAILVNCFFDPTLEGAQVAGVLYTLFGLGIIAARRSLPEPRDDAGPAALALPAPNGLARMG